MNEDLEKMAALNVMAWEQMLCVLMNPTMFPNSKINKLALFFWKLVGSRITPIMMMPDVPVAGIHFGVIQKKPTGKVLAWIQLPPRWYEMILKNPLFQGGAMVYTGSKAIDFWHDKYHDPNELQVRAQCWEAEYLIQTELMKPGRTDFTDYQRRVLDTYPKGVDSIPEHMQYEWKTWESASKLLANNEPVTSIA